MFRRFKMVLVALVVAVAAPALVSERAEAYVHLAGCQQSLDGFSGNDNDTLNYMFAHGYQAWQFDIYSARKNDGEIAVSVDYQNALGVWLYSFTGWCKGTDDAHMTNDEVTAGGQPAWY